MVEGKIQLGAFEQCGIVNAAKIRNGLHKMKSVTERQLYLQDMLAVNKFHQVVQLYEDRRYAERRRRRRKHPADESMKVGLQDRAEPQPSSITVKPETRDRVIRKRPLEEHICHTPQASAVKIPRRNHSEFVPASHASALPSVSPQSRPVPTVHEQQTAHTFEPFPVCVQTRVNVLEVFPNEVLHLDGAVFIRANCFLPLAAIQPHYRFPQQDLEQQLRFLQAPLYFRGQNR